MTIRRIFELAALRMMINEEHLADIRRLQEKPDMSEFKLRQDVFDLLLTMVTKENEFIMRLIKEIPEQQLKKITRDIIKEYGAKHSEKVAKRSRKEPSSKT